MSSITDPQRLVELVAHTMFRESQERARERRLNGAGPADGHGSAHTDEKENQRWTSSS
jgi:hypothetical protein